VRFTKLISFLDYLERVVVITGYLYGIYYLFDVAAPLASIAFVFVLITLIFVIYVRQILKKSKPAHEKTENRVAGNSLISEAHPVLSSSNLKYAAAISLVCFICLALIVSYEILVQQSSRYFPLKLLIGILLYSIFKQSLKRLVNLSMEPNRQ
jgi:uncharacterized membrane protein YadS